jgi:hypothetical protein
MVGTSELLPLLAALAATPAPTPGAETPRPVAKTADAARISRALNAMRPLGRETRLGPWRLLTDAAMGELTGLDAVARNLADTYTARFGLKTGADPDQAVVIYASSTRYRAFAAADNNPMLAARGHAGAGLAAFALGRNPLETRVALVHELTHLLSRNSLGENLPAWLDEGLADDLAWCRVDGAGRLEPGTLDLCEETRAGAPAVAPERSGPRAIVDAWLESARTGRLPPLAVILSPEARLFADPGARRDAVTASAMLVRWCLAEPARAAAFRAFLEAVSKGGAGDANALAAALGRSAPELQRDFSEWLKTL